jgi:hypothetical protein
VKRIYTIGLLALFLIPVLFSSGLATVEWNIQRTLNLKVAPVDVAISQNGRWIFVLTDTGSIHIYTPNGQLKEKINVGSQVDQIKVGPREDLLLLTSRQNKTVQVLTLDFITPVNVAGSPFKGSADAPVVIAVFNDFE